MTSRLARLRELAERTSSRTQVRLLWRPGTRQLWVEVREADADAAQALRVVEVVDDGGDQRAVRHLSSP